jgi:PAS domain S-box-containing protein
MKTAATPEGENPIEKSPATSSRFLRILEAPNRGRHRDDAENARQYSEFLEALGIAVYTTDAHGVITSYNTAAAELWGRRPETGKDLWCGSWKIYHLDGVTVMPHDQCPMAVCLRERRPVRGVEAIAERPDGSRVYFRPFPTPLYDEAGDLAGAVNVLVDVTENKQAELASVHLAAIVESSDDAIISKDLKGIITSWNPGAERVFGYTAKEAIDKSIRMLIPHDRQHEEDEVIARIRRGEFVDHFETVRRRKDGSEVEVSLSISPIKSRSGAVIGASKIALDISERRRAEAQAREAFEQSIAMKDQVLGLVSHELRTPITTILGNALILLRRNDKLPEDTRRQALGDVANEAERLQRIIENLLLLTRVDADEHVDTEPLRLQPLIAQTVETLRLRNPRRNVEVTYDEELPIVQGQSEFLALVIENLITNADKYSPPESTIEVLVHPNGRDDVEVCVRDYGIGLDESDTEQMFTPFYRSARARSQAKGIGLGLAVCKRVMEAQGGSIRAVSRPDGGSDFIFSIKRYRDDGE